MPKAGEHDADFGTQEIPSKTKNGSFLCRDVDFRPGLTRKLAVQAVRVCGGPAGPDLVDRVWRRRCGGRRTGGRGRDLSVRQRGVCVCVFRGEEERGEALSHTHAHAHALTRTHARTHRHYGSRRKRRFREHTMGAVSVATSPDGSLAASSYQDGTIQMWDVASGNPAAEAIETSPRAFAGRLAPTNARARSHAPPVSSQCWCGLSRGAIAGGSWPPEALAAR